MAVPKLQAYYTAVLIMAAVAVAAAAMVVAMVGGRVRGRSRGRRATAADVAMVTVTAVLSFASPRSDQLWSDEKRGRNNQQGGGRKTAQQRGNGESSFLFFFSKYPNLTRAALLPWPQ